MSALEQVDPPTARVPELAVVTDPHHTVEPQDFHQVSLEAATELDSPTSACSVGMEVSDPAVTLVCLEAPATALLM